MSTKRSCMRNATNINHLPDEILAEILSRLPCFKLITRCKCVSKRWGNVISQHSFIVLCLQSGQMQTPTTTLVSTRGKEFLSRMSCLPKPLDHLFQKLTNTKHMRTPTVVGTFNDLVLCCSSGDDGCRYFICNPFTNHWVTLPPPPPSPVDIRIQDIHVGFMCDLPYYEYCKKDNKGEHVTHLNSKYSCNVVRFFCPSDQRKSLMNEFTVQIFSSDTGVWRELIVSSPKAFKFDRIVSRSFACNGMLYWGGHRFVIGLDPFMIEKSNSEDEHNYRCHFIEIDRSDEYVNLFCLGVKGKCLKLADYNLIDTLCLCDLNVDQNDIERGRAGKVLYTLLIKDIIMCNIQTREWSKIFDQKLRIHHHITGFYPLVIPSWPTPLPHTMKSVTRLCKYGCGLSMTRNEIREHEKQCLGSSDSCVCPGCNFVCSFQDLYDHFSRSNHSAYLFNFGVSFTVKLGKNKEFYVLRERTGGELFILKNIRNYEGRGREVTFDCIQPSFMRGFKYVVTSAARGNGRPFKFVSIANGIAGVYEDSGPLVVIPSAFLSSAGEGEITVCIMGR